jgi:hypothetical protein
MGLNIYHLYTLQEISRLKDIILHTFNDTLTGKLYRTSLELFFIELGLSPTGHWDISTVDLLTTPSLIKATMLFIKQHNIALKHYLTTPLLRDNDIFIMDALLQLNLSPQELRACNHCRIFLKVTRLSEITTGDGDAISEEAWLGQSTLPKHNDNAWPNYPKPPHTSWTIWQKCIFRAFIRRGRKLRTALGKWLDWDTNWQWYMTKDGSLYSLSEGLWFCHAPILKRNRLPTYEEKPCPCETPRSPQRATVYKKGNRIVCTGSADFSSTSMPKPISFYDYLSTKTSIGWCLDSLHMKEDGLALATTITDGLSAHIMAISDGSFKDGFGTAAWTIGTEETTDLISGRAICPGGPGDQSAYRSELTGLFYILSVVHHLCIFYNINEGHIEVGCDGYSALQTAMETTPSLNTDIPDYDLVGAIYTLRRASTIVWSFRHVKGHQDDHSTDLDVWAQRNVQMDLNAKVHLSKARSSPRHYDIPGEPWQLWVNGQKVKAAIFSTIYSHVHNGDGELYWAEKGQQELATISNIEWPLIGTAMRSIPRPRRVFISKHVSGMCGVGKFMKWWKE